MTIETTLSAGARIKAALAELDFWRDLAQRHRRSLSATPTAFDISILFDYLARAADAGEAALADMPLGQARRAALVRLVAELRATVADYAARTASF